MEMFYFLCSLAANQTKLAFSEVIASQFAAMGQVKLENRNFNLLPT